MVDFNTGNTRNHDKKCKKGNIDNKYNYKNDQILLHYNYFKNNRKFTGAGILIVTSIYGKPYIILGREEYKSFKFKNDIVLPIYEEFGGGIQNKNISLEQNALLELDEETAHTLKWSDPRVLLKKGFKFFDIPYLNDRLYRLYVVYVSNVQDIVPDFFRNLQMIRGHPNKIRKKRNYIEMDDLRLINLNSINYNINNKKKYELNLPNNDLILNLSKDNIYLSKRIYFFLKESFEINNKTKRGIEYCYDIFNYCRSNRRFNSIKLNRPFINRSTRYHKIKYPFLENTITYDTVEYNI